MENIKSRHKTWIKIIAMVVVCLFTVNTVSWAYPGGRVSALNINLQVPSIFSPLAYEGIEISAEMQFELISAVRLLLNGKNYKAVNGYLTETYRDSESKKRKLTFLEDPQGSGDNITAKFTVKNPEGEDVAFEIQYKGTKLDKEEGLTYLDVFQKDDMIKITKITPEQTSDVRHLSAEALAKADQTSDLDRRSMTDDRRDTTDKPKPSAEWDDDDVGEEGSTTLHMKGIATIAGLIIGACFGFPGLGLAIGLLIDFRDPISKLLNGLIDRLKTAKLGAKDKKLPASRAKVVGGKNIFEILRSENRSISHKVRRLRYSISMAWYQIKSSIKRFARPAKILFSDFALKHYAFICFYYLYVFFHEVGHAVGHELTYEGAKGIIVMFPPDWPGIGGYYSQTVAGTLSLLGQFLGKEGSDILYYGFGDIYAILFFLSVALIISAANYIYKKTGLISKDNSSFKLFEWAPYVIMLAALFRAAPHIIWGLILGPKTHDWVRVFSHTDGPAKTYAIIAAIAVFVPAIFYYLKKLCPSLSYKESIKNVRSILLTPFKLIKRLFAKPGAKSAKAASTNVTCGTICEAGHEGSYEALDNQLQRQFEEYRKALKINEDRDLTEEEVDGMLVMKGYAESTEQLYDLREEIRKKAGVPATIKIFFGVPEGNSKLWWVGEDYAGGHFNKKGTRIHISLPLILSKSDPAEAGSAIALHDLKHIQGKGHETDAGLAIVKDVAGAEKLGAAPAIAPEKVSSEELKKEFNLKLTELKREFGKAGRDFDFMTRYSGLIDETLRKLAVNMGLDDKLTILALGSYGRMSTAYGTDVDVFLVAPKVSAELRRQAKNFTETAEEIVGIHLDFPAYPDGARYIEGIYCMGPTEFERSYQTYFTGEEQERDMAGLRATLDWRHVSGPEVLSELEKIKRRAETLKKLQSSWALREDSRYLMKRMYSAKYAFDPGGYHTKAGRSGLRSINMIIWISRVFNGIASWDWEDDNAFGKLMDELIRRKFFSVREARALEGARDFMLRLRTASNIVRESIEGKPIEELTDVKDVFREDIAGEVADMMGMPQDDLIKEFRRHYRNVDSIIDTLLAENEEYDLQELERERRGTEELEVDRRLFERDEFADEERDEELEDIEDEFEEDEEETPRELDEFDRLVIEVAKRPSADDVLESPPAAAPVEPAADATDDRRPTIDEPKPAPLQGGLVTGQAAEPVDDDLVEKFLRDKEVVIRTEDGELFRFKIDEKYREFTDSVTGEVVERFKHITAEEIDSPESSTGTFAGFCEFYFKDGDAWSDMGVTPIPDRDDKPAIYADERYHHRGLGAVFVFLSLHYAYSKGMGTFYSRDLNHNSRPLLRRMGYELYDEKHEGRDEEISSAKFVLTPEAISRIKMPKILTRKQQKRAMRLYSRVKKQPTTDEPKPAPLQGGLVTGQAAEPRPTTDNLSRQEEKLITAENKDEGYLLAKVTRQLEGHPVNMHVDLSVIPAAEGQLEKNMETLARVIAWHNTFGLNVRYILENDAGGKALGILKSKLAELARLPGVDPEKLMASVGTPHAGEGVIKVNLKNFEAIDEETTKILDNEYVVALKDDGATPGVSIPNYTAAATIGLSLAALRVIKDKNERSGDYETIRDRVLKKLGTIYKRNRIIEGEKDFSVDELEFMVTGSSDTKLYYTIVYALPPAAKMSIEKINELHDITHRVLQAA